MADEEADFSVEDGDLTSDAESEAVASRSPPRLLAAPLPQKPPPRRTPEPERSAAWHDDTDEVRPPSPKARPTARRARGSKSSIAPPPKSSSLPFVESSAPVVAHTESEEKLTDLARPPATPQTLQGNNMEVSLSSDEETETSLRPSTPKSEAALEPQREEGVSSQLHSNGIAADRGSSHCSEPEMRIERVPAKAMPGKKRKRGALPCPASPSPDEYVFDGRPLGDIMAEEFNQSFDLLVAPLPLMKAASKAKAMTPSSEAAVRIQAAASWEESLVRCPRADQLVGASKRCVAEAPKDAAVIVLDDSDEGEMCDEAASASALWRRSSPLGDGKDCPVARYMAAAVAAEVEKKTGAADSEVDASQEDWAPVLEDAYMDLDDDRLHDMTKDNDFFVDTAGHADFAIAIGTDLLSRVPHT